MRGVAKLFIVVLFLVSVSGCGSKEAVVDMGAPQTQEQQERAKAMIESDMQSHDALKNMMQQGADAAPPNAAAPATADR